MITASEIMTRHVVFIDPEAPVEEAIELMLRHGVSGLPVVNSCGELLGVITEFDILDIINDPDNERCMVFHFMTRDPEVVEANTPLFDLAARFQARSVRRYPVVDNGLLVGIISRRELIRFVHDVRAAVRQRCEAAPA
ncbi:MAG: CBS domain-containing protein [Planctomycetales bacterium]|nr:CBS domain-containing protein [Planctomycetales bacterium]